ncbi:MAG: DUF5008 domain-containing protein [Niabella sp.]
MFYTKKYSRKLLWMIAAGFALFAISCQKDNFGTADIYPDNAAVDISFGSDAPQPSTVSEGTIVKYSITGLKEKAQGSYKFYINQMEASILEVTDTYISVRVPVNASSGSASLVLDNGQIYYGPGVAVRGKTQIAADFLSNIGANKALLNGFPSTLLGIVPNGDGSFIVYGVFDQYGDPSNASNITSNIQIIDNTGKALTASKQFTMGKQGLNGGVTNLKILDDGSYLVSGGFSKYDTVDNVSGIVRFLSGGKADLTQYEIANADPENHPENNFRIGSAINAGFGGGVLSTFVSDDEKYITVGNYKQYNAIYYPNSTVQSTQLDMIASLGLTKIDAQGNFDSTFNYNYATKQSYVGPNGYISSAVQLYEGQLVLGGTFTTFHGSNAQHLVCIDPMTGLVSNAFQGSTDGPVYSITYNETTERLVIVGNFKHYNGTPVNAGVAVVKEDGTLDTDAMMKPIQNGIVSYCAQLDDGRFIISGSFLRYDGVVRSGFAILNEDGTLASGYNNTGLFRGTIYGHAEFSIAGGGTALFLVGSFDRFDNKEVGSIVKIVLSDN